MDVVHAGLLPAQKLDRIEAIVENYREYRDYNTTTTQSDHGELLYTLVDFLRLRADYDRVAWNLKPVIMAHEILVRHDRSVAAELWQRALAERTAETADANLARFDARMREGLKAPLPDTRGGTAFAVWNRTGGTPCDS